MQNFQRFLERITMGFLKLTPKPPPDKSPKPPRAITKPQATKRIRTLTGLSQTEIELAIEKEYIDKGAILLHFSPTAISNFKISIDGRFGIRHNDKLRFFQLFIFVEKKKVEDFLTLTFDNLKFMEATQYHYFYNDKMPTADMQMGKIAQRICIHLGGELEKVVQEKRENWHKIEDEQTRVRLEAERIIEEMEDAEALAKKEEVVEAEPALPSVEEQKPTNDLDLLWNI